MFWVGFVNSEKEVKSLLVGIQKELMYLVDKKTRFGWILLEHHTKDCTCSYCKGETKLHYGLNIPKDWKAKNSWYVIKFWRGWYLRWVNSWLRYFN